MAKIKEGIKLKAKWIFSLIDEDTGQVVERKVYENIIVTVGKVAVARRLGGAGVKANEGEITYIAIGTNATAPTVGDTGLGTELSRKTVTYGGLTGAQVSIRAYWTKSEGNGALREVGAFGEDAGAGAGSGTLFNHVNIVVAKDVTKGLQVELSITVS